MSRGSMGGEMGGMRGNQYMGDHPGQGRMSFGDHEGKHGEQH